MTAYLNINNVVKKFGSFTALNDISLQIQQGEFVCFLGPSGCGKTTLLRAIAGLDLANSGCITQAQRDITFLPPEQRDFGIVFQSYALFPNLTVAENIAVGLYNQGKSVAETQQIIQHWLNLIGLENASSKYPNQLSGGQQQRIALARALALSPGLLLLDEPLSALDAKVRTHLRDEIKSLQQKLGITTVMVTHDQEEALAMADRIVVMNHGVIEQVGTPEEIYAQPNSRFVAEFVGSMNFIKTSAVNAKQIRIAETILSRPQFSKQTDFAASGLFDLAIRPEDIHFSQAFEGIPVTVMALEFQGTYLRADCQLSDDSHSKLIKVDVPIREARNLHLQRGDRRKILLGEQPLHAFSRRYTATGAEAKCLA